MWAVMGRPRPGRGRGVLGLWPRGVHDHVDLAAAQPAVAADVRDLIVDLGDHPGAPADQRGHVVGPEAQPERAVGPGGRQGQEQHVRAERAVAQDR